MTERDAPSDSQPDSQADAASSELPVAASGGMKRAPGVNGLVSSAMVAFVTIGILVAVPYAIPGMERFRLLTPLPEGAGLQLAPPEKEATVGEAELPDTSGDDVDKLAQPEEVEIPQQARKILGSSGETEKPKVSIEHPEALDAYFKRLAAVHRKEPGAIARLSVWGDSNVAGDLIPSVVRRRLQARFGDAGHGFVLLARASRRYWHNDVRLISAGGWRISRVPGPLAADGFYGIGGTSFRAVDKLAHAKIGTANKGSYGRNVSRFVVNYLEHPTGEKLEVLIDGESREVFDTKADEPRSAIKAFEVPDGSHEIELRTLGPQVRVFGVWLERDGPGVVVDALGMTASKVRYLLRIDKDHLAEQLKLRDSNLWVYNFGVNEAREGEKLFGGMDKYESTLEELITTVQERHPSSSCMIVAPNDITYTTGDGLKFSFPLIPKLVKVQRRVAGKMGCAFWNMFEAMGGENSMGEWLRLGLGEEDMLHPSKSGAQILGNWLYLALMEAYDAYLQRHPDDGHSVPELPKPASSGSAAPSAAAVPSAAPGG